MKFLANKLMSMAIIAVTVLAMSGCKASPQKSPEKNVNRIMECIKNNDVNGMIEYFYISDRDKERFIRFYDKTVGDEIRGKRGIKSYKITETKIDKANDTAYVNVHVIYGDNSENDIDFNMVKINDVWLQRMEE